jgi:hypothetical protein
VSCLRCYFVLAQIYRNGQRGATVCIAPGIVPDQLAVDDFGLAFDEIECFHQVFLGGCHLLAPLSFIRLPLFRTTPPSAAPTPLLPA